MTSWFKAIALALLIALAGIAQAQSRTGGAFNGTYAGLGLKGYDPVGYFTENKAVKGSERFTTQHGGVTWQFASAQNRDTFAANPTRYAPQYGGFCA